jgi:membrane protease YdiL (CAAX protease family)
MPKNIISLIGKTLFSLVLVLIPAQLIGFAELMKIPLLSLIITIIAISACVAVYSGVMNYLVMPTGLNTQNWRPRFMQGVGLGVLLILIYFVFLMGGHFQTVTPPKFNFLDNLVTALALALAAGFLEEIMCRGILFGFSEKLLGTGIGVFFQAIIFGALHIARPDVQLADVLEISCAGLLFGAAYAMTRTLWFSIGMHFTFDFLAFLEPGAIEAMEKKGVPYTTTEFYLLMLLALFEVALAWHMLKKARVAGNWIGPLWKQPALLSTGSASE